MDEVEIDAEERTAWVGAGCRGRPCSRPPRSTAWPRSSPSSTAIGAVGYTLGGGLGWLARRYGPACDAVRSFEVVTPDGELVRARRAREPRAVPRPARRGRRRPRRGDRDGGRPVPRHDRLRREPLVPGRGRRRGRDRWSAWVAEAPDELTSSVVLDDSCPTTPGAVLVRGCWCGEPTTGRAAARRVAGADAADEPTPGASCRSPTSPRSATTRRAVARRHHRGVARRSRPRRRPPPRGRRRAGRGHVRRRPAVLRYAEIRHAGGAVARGRARRPSSMGNRDRPFLLQLVGGPATPDAAAAAPPAARRRRARRAADDRTYLNGLATARRAAPPRRRRSTRRTGRHRRLRADVDPTTSCASASTTAADRLRAAA